MVRTPFLQNSCSVGQVGLKVEPGVAMEFMGSYQEKYINGNDTNETEYWLKLGREGLARELRATSGRGWLGH